MIGFTSLATLRSTNSGLGALPDRGYPRVDDALERGVTLLRQRIPTGSSSAARLSCAAASFGSAILAELASVISEKAAKDLIQGRLHLNPDVDGAGHQRIGGRRRRP